MYILRRGVRAANKTSSVVCRGGIRNMPWAKLQLFKSSPSVQETNPGSRQLQVSPRWSTLLSARCTQWCSLLYTRWLFYVNCTHPPPYFWRMCKQWIQGPLSSRELGLGTRLKYNAHAWKRPPVCMAVQRKSVGSPQRSNFRENPTNFRCPLSMWHRF